MSKTPDRETLLEAAFEMLRSRLIVQPFGTYWRCEVCATTWWGDHQFYDRGEVHRQDCELHALFQRRALAAQSAPSAVGPTVLVPREPTEAMLAAAVNALRRNGGDPDYSEGDALDVWSAMLAAAPSAPQGGENVCPENMQRVLARFPKAACIQVSGCTVAVFKNGVINSADVLAMAHTNRAAWADAARRLA